MNSSEAIFESFTTSSNERIILKIVKSIEDLENDKINFNPQFSHQFFGERETIFGFKKPTIELYFSSISLSPYFKFSYEDIIVTQDGIHADDINKIILDKVDDVNYDIEVFKNVVVNDCNLNVGKLIHQYTSNSIKGENDVFEIYHIKDEDLQSKSFVNLNNRLQYLLLFFVDGSSFIDITDTNWEYFVIFQRCRNSTKPDVLMPIGFMTVYNFFSYPDKIRQRISQVLILPPYQRLGHGGQLLNSFYRSANSNPSVYDITVEDPSDQFQMLRDFIDCNNVIELKIFNKNIIKKGLFKKFSLIMKEKLKMTDKQIIHIYEILGYKFLDRNNEIEVMKFKQSIIKRLTTIFGRAKDFDNIDAQAYLNTNQEKKVIMIEREFERLKEYYDMVVPKLNK